MSVHWYLEWQTKAARALKLVGIHSDKQFFNKITVLQVIIEARNDILITL